ncbi:MAG: hypothetical protein O3A84_15670 [Proteobacteria bacterium]|nr:hypothetical protein [Pseudomonadota bacterium]
MMIQFLFHAMPLRALVMGVLIGIALPLYAVSAAEPTAVVEEASGGASKLTVFELLEPGQKYRLSSDEMIVIGYLRSCQREEITGGVVTIGESKSTVTGGRVSRGYVECDGGKMDLSLELAGKSAVTVFRSKPGKTDPNLPSLTIFGASPVILLARPVKEITFARLDKPELKLRVPVSGLNVDLTKTDDALSPGGVYGLVAGDRRVIFKVDPFSKPGAGPLVQRLIKF